MKMITTKYLLPLLGFLLLVPSADAEEQSQLDKMLTERIKMHEKYRDDYAKDAEESELAKELVPLEKKVGQGYVDYMIYLRDQKDIKLKKRVLHLELLGELTYAYYDLENAETFIQKATARSAIAKWKKKLAALEKIDTEGKTKKPVTPIAEPAKE